MRRRIPFLLAVAAVAACGFPDVNYSTSPVDGASPPFEASGDDGPPVTGNEAGDGVADGPAYRDASEDVNDAAGGDVGVDSATDGAMCDYDQDQYPAQGAACGGLDCDDHDPHANPGVMNFQTYPPHPPTNGDWNCDGVVEKEFTPNVSCNMLMLGPACATLTGFIGDPPCGSVGAFVQCAAGTLGLTCTEGAMSMQVQGCK